MYDNDLTYRMIKARIWHSYQTDLDNSQGQCDVHLETLLKRYDFNKFTDSFLLEVCIRSFLEELQDEVDNLIGMLSMGMVIKEI